MVTKYSMGCQYSLVIKEKTIEISVRCYSAYAKMDEHMTIPYGGEDEKGLESAYIVHRYIN